jgi:hypothetical protein
MWGRLELGPDIALAIDGRRHLNLKGKDDEGCNISLRARKHEAFCTAMTNRRLIGKKLTRPKIKIEHARRL